MRSPDDKPICSVHIDDFSIPWQKRKEINKKSKPGRQIIPRRIPLTIEHQGKKYPISLGSVKYKLFHKDDYTCCCCGLRATAVDIYGDQPKPHYVLFRGREDRFLTIDHIHPRSKGGKNKFSNLQTLCNVCNIARGNKKAPGCFYIQSPKCDNGYSEKLLVTTNGDVFDASIFEINGTFKFYVRQPKHTIPVGKDTYDSFRSKVIDLAAFKKVA